MKIKLLDASVANKIAAGEVVERPASIVKELAENSIDAGATNITVEIRGGGIDLIRITDNGCGMDEDDVKNAFLRHATSKISVADDLNDIVTLGFRGEALASVAAVSSIRLSTRTHASDEGTEIELSGGEILKFCACGCPEGTGIWVRDLFFNTPARRKFLKRPSQESTYVADVVERLALSHPEISFRCVNEGKTVIRTPGDGQLLSAIRAIFGSTTAENVIRLEYQKAGISVSGYLGKREIQKNNRANQLLFINGRTVKNDIVSAAVHSAYAGRLNVGKFPFFVLEMKLSGNLVDVNVHPTKQEVRFADGLPVYDVIFAAVKQALDANQEIPSLFKSESIKADTATVTEVSGVGAGVYRPVALSDVLPQEKINEIHVIKNDDEKIKTTCSVYDGTSAKEKQAKTENTAVKSVEEAASVRDDPAQIKLTLGETSSLVMKFAEFAQMSRGVLTVADSTEKKETEFGQNSDTETQESNEPSVQDAEQVTPTVSEEARQETFFSGTEQQDELPSYSVVGTLFDTYIIVAAGDEAYIIDQHAAHERLLFERLYAAQGDGASQILLIPQLISLSPRERAMLDGIISQLEEMGFEIEDMGFSNISVKATPSALGDIDCERFIMSLLDESNAFRQVRTNELKREKLMQLACKSAVKAGDKLTVTDIKTLMKLIVKERVPLSCPHGRPILIRLTRHELEVRFKRIQ